eukprot:2289198-Amphidinium_carterae.1
MKLFEFLREVATLRAFFVLKSGLGKSETPHSLGYNYSCFCNVRLGLVGNRLFTPKLNTFDKLRIKMAMPRIIQQDNSPYLGLSILVT